jgi:transcriptional regulator with XRE-family HTH domain
VEKLSKYRGLVDFDPIWFGRRVAAARAWAGLKPKELAAALARSTEAINAIERGDRVQRPDTHFVRALAGELHVTEEWLLAGDVPPWALSPGQPAGIDPRLVRAAEQIADAAATLDALVSEQARQPAAPPSLPQAS